MKKLAVIFISTCLLTLHVFAQQAPNFSATDLNGQKVELNAFKGKYVLLDFWATWCPPCMAKIPFLKDIRKKYPVDKLEIISVSLDHTKAQCQRTVHSKGMNWIHIYDRQNIPSAYGISYIPTLFLIDPKGKIIYNNDVNTESELLRILDQI
ncbi:MAG: TlpA family protein disulfide reductase [Chitinophaga sp.]|uniref:TlpA family protein disulfide reductase n=1 Tax=Chitinophaga sp. TaxID=1869181 RepID=UPI0025C2BE5E|nr:TlpA disulfide reductase family protein [Chitinophaga sp.]MBV8255165.1 TlpA family protein disulfide reductase [Chitinophaga sp.]